MTRVLVLGGTGLLGRPVTTRLRDDGFDVRVLARDPAEAEAIFAGTVDVIAGDVTDRQGLQQAMKGCEGVHISVGGPVDQASAENVAAAAPGVGVQRITYLSGATVTPGNDWFPMVAQKLAAERALEAGAVPATVLRPTWPFEQLPRFIINGVAMVIGEQPTPLHWFAAADLARMVSAAYQTDEAAGATVFVHGPEALTMRDALERYRRAEHPQLDPVTVVPIEAARARAEASHDPRLGFMVSLMSYFDTAGELGDSAEADRLLGRNTITLDMWLEQRRHAA